MKCPTSHSHDTLEQKLHLFTVLQHELTSGDVVRHGKELHVDAQLLYIVLGVTLQAQRTLH